MKLVIVESPAKAKTIGKYLGPDYRVDASKGHIWDLPVKTMGIDFANHYAPDLEPRKPEQTETINRLRREVAQAECVYLATDPVHALCDGAQSLRPEDYASISQPTRTAKEKQYLTTCKARLGLTRKRKIVSCSTKFRKKPSMKPSKTLTTSTKDLWLHNRLAACLTDW